MNYGQVRDFTLKLLNQYTMTGNIVPDSYNCQVDYVNRIPSLVNDAMTEIATSAHPIVEVLDLGALEPESRGNYWVYTLPEDVYQLVTGGVLVERGGHVERTMRYLLQGKNNLLIPKSGGGQYSVEYHRLPRLLSDKPKDTDELDNTPATHTAIPYYVAAQLVIHDDAFLYSAFYNKYEDKLAKLVPGLQAEQTEVRDQYPCGDLWGGDY